MFERHKYVEPKKVDWQSVKDPHATPKFDGGHYFLSVQSDGSLKYYSRRESVKGGFPERSSQLPHLADKKLPQFAGHVFSVELIHTGHKKENKESHSTAGGILNSLTPKAIETQKEKGPIRAVLLDVINPPMRTFGDKLVHMNNFEKAFNKPDVLFVPKAATTPEQIVKLIQSSKAEGKEGVIVTSKTEPEESNPRIKLKHFDTYNLRPVKIIQEVDKFGKPKQSMGAIDCADASGRVVATIGTGFTREEREDAFKNPEKWLSDLVQVKTMGWGSVGGKLRMPVYNGPADGDIDLIKP